MPNRGATGALCSGPPNCRGPQAVEEAPKLERYCLPTFNCLAPHYKQTHNYF